MKKQEHSISPSSPWTREIETLYSDFSTSADGLSDAEVRERRKEYGPNAFKKTSRTSFFALLWRQISSPLIFVLIVASVLTIILREPIDTAVILLAIVVNVTLGLSQENKAENTIEKLTAYIKELARVVRNGTEHEIDSADVVPGDILRLSLGVRVPADMRIISSNALSVDESILTGESLPVSKRVGVVAEATPVAERTNMAFAGSLVVEGYATGLVVSTGRNTEIGRIADLVAGTKRELTPLQRSLRGLAWVIFVGVLVFVVGIFFLGLSRGEAVLAMLLLSAAVAVGSIPEALPISLTVILSVGVERLARAGGIMRSLGAAETLGSTTLVMTDKTGTLTQAKMDLTGIMTLSELRGGNAAQKLDDISDEQRRIVSGALIATDVAIENPHDDVDAWHIIGRPLEANIARTAQRLGINVVELVGARRVSVIPFSSKHKFSVSRDITTDTTYIFGAPDVLLAKSSLSADDQQVLEERIHEISGEGKRLLGVGVVHNAIDASGVLRVEDVSAIEMLGVLVLYDPVRPEVADALARIRSYGARVVMVTGDLKGTARAIARELKWHVEPEHILTGAEIHDMNDKELRERLADVEIFARVTPEDKLRIGRLYQNRGEVVAMTGDGVNDAPSLKAVDIGIALGSGSDVAKSVADLVLLDDDFTTIVRAVEEGRRIISNIRKSFVYLMSNSLDAVILIGGGLLFGLPLPLTALQIIWVNFFTGSLPALSFAFESSHGSNPGPRESRAIFNFDVKILTIAAGTATSLALFLVYWLLLRSGVDLELTRSLLFACFASYILAIAFSFKDFRKPLFSYPLFDNIPLLASIAGATLLIIASFAIPSIRNALGIVLIPASHLWIIGAWLVGNISLIELVKWVFRAIRMR